MDSCLRKIKHQNSLKKTDLIFTISDKIQGIPEYDSIKCLSFIEKTLKTMFMDTLIIDNVSIFISWKNIEENKNN